MINIYLFCNAGMSTSILVNKIQEAADQEGIQCKVAAFPVTQASSKGKEADIILLGPQVRYLLKKVSDECPDKKVDVIDMRAYGMMDGKAVFAQVKTVLGL